MKGFLKRVEQILSLIGFIGLCEKLNNEGGMGKFICRRILLLLTKFETNFVIIS